MNSLHVGLRNIKSVKIKMSSGGSGGDGGNGNGQKTKEERLQEGLEILKKLKEIGVTQYTTGWDELQSTISLWVREGEPWHGKIKFPGMGRVAELVLPGRSGRVANMWFRVAN